MRKVFFVFFFLVSSFVFQPKQAQADSHCRLPDEAFCFEKVDLNRLLDPQQQGSTLQKVENFRVGFYRILDNFVVARATQALKPQESRAIQVSFVYSIGNTTNAAIQAYNEGSLDEQSFNTLLVVQMARCQKLLDTYPVLNK